MLFCAATALAQEPLPNPPTTPEFMSRFDFRMWAAALSYDDPRFVWDTHWAGDFDLVDYVYGRATFVADYEALLGNEYRPFDPYQSNYLLEAAGSIRFPRVEMFVVLNHVSRHLGDRPKRLGVAWNMLGARFLHHAEAGSTTIDVALEGGRVVARAFVDYTWLGEANLLLRHPFNANVGAFAHATGQVFAVDEVAMRGTQAGGRIEAGIRLKGRGGVMEIFGGYEKRVDAYPLDRVPQRWGVAGVRLLSR